VGRIEPIDDNHCRLVGSTSDPEWYAEVLASIPTSFRVVSGPEVKKAVGELAARLLAACAEH
jgi:hypothetical protein